MLKKQLFVGLFHFLFLSLSANLGYYTLFGHQSDNKNKNNILNAFQMELRTTYIRTTDGG